jgi:pimeloyl-ACP methyl ester carboxylesterase
MNRFEHAGISFAYEDEAADATPLALLHGLGGGRAAALELAHPQPGWRRVAIDFRAHGETHPVGPPDAFRFATFADDLHALLDTRQIESAVVAGVSMGSGVAVRFALDHPERVNSLILVRPAWLHTPLTDNLLPYLEIARLLRTLDPQQAQLKFTASRDYAAIQATSFHAASSLVGQFQRPEARQRAICLDQMPRSTPYGEPSELAHVSCPTLVIGCARDPLHPIEFAQEWTALIPHATLELIISPADDVVSHREAVRQAVTSFMASDHGNAIRSRTKEARHA